MSRRRRKRREILQLRQRWGGVQPGRRFARPKNNGRNAKWTYSFAHVCYNAMRGQIRAKRRDRSKRGKTGDFSGLKCQNRNSLNGLNGRFLHEKCTFLHAKKTRFPPETGQSGRFSSPLLTKRSRHVQKGGRTNTTAFRQTEDTICLHSHPGEGSRTFF